MIVNSSALRFAPPAIGQAEINEVLETFRSGWLSTGPRVQAFERAFGESVGASSIGRFRDQLWMTSYEASVFLQDSDIALPEYQPAATVGAVA
jgi:hypothetical protein